MTQPPQFSFERFYGLKREGETDASFARRAGTTPGNLWKWKPAEPDSDKKAQQPDGPTTALLAHRLGVSAWWLYGGEEDALDRAVRLVPAHERARAAKSLAAFHADPEPETSEAQRLIDEAKRHAKAAGHKSQTAMDAAAGAAPTKRGGVTPGRP